MLAYHSRQAQAHAVRDLVDGSETTSPVTVKEEHIGIGSMLVVSDDGRHVVFDPREGSKEPGLLIDVRTGRTVRIPGKYEPVNIKDGVDVGTGRARRLADHPPGKPGGFLVLPGVASG